MNISVLREPRLRVEFELYPYAFVLEHTHTHTHTSVVKSDLLTFWFSNFGQFFVMAPKG